MKRKYVLTLILLTLLGVVAYSNRNILKQDIRPNLLDQKFQNSDTTDLLIRNVSTTNNSYIIRLHNKVDRFFCSGFVIDDNYAITAAHCVDEAGGLMSSEIFIYNSKSEYTGQTALAAGMSTRMDYAIIRGDFKSFDKIAIETNKVEINKDGYYTSCGFPLGNKKLFCSKVKLTGTNDFSIVGEAFLYPGMSGGPLIDLQTNKAVGVNSYVYQGNAGFFPLIGILNAFGIE